MKHVITVEPKRGEPRRMHLEEGACIVIGRGTRTDVSVDDAELSRRHCSIGCAQDGIRIKDLESRNGIRVNGVRIDGDAPLKPGDIVTIGSTVIRIEAGDPVIPDTIRRKPEDDEVACLGCGRIGKGPCPLNSGRYLASLDFIPKMQIERFLGAGGMGVVFQALEAGGAPIAVKVIVFPGDHDETGLQRFLREARIPGKLRHENVVRTLGSGITQVKPHRIHGEPVSPGFKAGYILLEYVDGLDLQSLVKTGGPVPVREAVRIGLCVADALTTALLEGVVHRDIKPRNILIASDGRVKLADFGLAKSFEEAGLSGITASGDTLGTPAFIPPEQVHDSKFVDQRADIYSLGATLFFALTGKPPFPGDKAREILNRVLDDPAPRLVDFNPDAPAALSGILERCMQKAPEDRYQTSDHLWADIKGVLDDIG